ncbi:hypothetical protein PH235_08735 [Trichococcus sp. K1Tr]|uniref:hypothetical protein n=1 Tax=Trichococcus sp. K1Tr TaxID=3020847 RepID=UPI00232D49F7|nr:hypothetical protein [Trichococcus sp. K1Tr]MDB6353643.1 hypothetical protein [Trichococcus sp. K1Tr]
MINGNKIIPEENAAKLLEATYKFLMDKKRPYETLEPQKITFTVHNFQETETCPAPGVFLGVDMLDGPEDWGYQHQRWHNKYDYGQLPLLLPIEEFQIFKIGKTYTAKAVRKTTKSNSIPYVYYEIFDVEDTGDTLKEFPIEKEKRIGVPYSFVFRVNEILEQGEHWGYCDAPIPLIKAEILEFHSEYPTAPDLDLVEEIKIFDHLLLDKLNVGQIYCARAFSDNDAPYYRGDNPDEDIQCFYFYLRLQEMPLRLQEDNLNKFLRALQ